VPCKKEESEYISYVIQTCVMSIGQFDFNYQSLKKKNNTENADRSEIGSLSAYTGWSKKMAQSLWHHNFATVHHRVMRFSAKCSERNSLHDLNTAVKYSLFWRWQVHYWKNRITFNVPWSIKNCHYYFFNSSLKHWPISIIFGMRH